MKHFSQPNACLSLWAYIEGFAEERTVMPDSAELEALPIKEPIIVSFAVRPEEIELALATHGNSLRHRLLLALVAELTIVEDAPASTPPPCRSRRVKPLKKVRPLRKRVGSSAVLCST